MNAYKQQERSEGEAVSGRTLGRLPLYLSYLKSLSERPETISAAIIARQLNLNHVLVRKDLAYVGQGGRPRTGYVTEELIADIERFMGYRETSRAVVVGAGKMSEALMEYEGFSEYGLEIVALFSNRKNELQTCGCIRAFPVEKLGEICRRMHVQIGIVAVPAAEAQAAADLLADGGVRAIWNLSPAHLNVPDWVLVENENMGASLAMLSKRLCQKSKGGHQAGN